MLSKKYYKRIATIIRDTKALYGCECTKAIERIEFQLRQYFAEDNFRFDSVKFTEACRVKVK